MKSLILFTLIFEAFLLGGGLRLDCTDLSPPSLVADGYVPQGVNLVSAGMNTYETGAVNATKALILVYDALGFDTNLTNLRQVCDRLGSYGYKVVMPDFFHGGSIPITPANAHCPLDRQDELPYTWNGTVRDDLAEVLRVYKSQGVQEFGIFGFCFGGRMSAIAVDEFSGDIKVAGQFHPFGTIIQDSFGIKRPNLLLPGANDPDMTTYCGVINEMLGDDSCVYNHFRDVDHGFAGNGGIWSNETVRMRAEEAFRMWEEFLCDKFPPPN